MTYEIVHSLILILTILGAFVFSRTSLINYNLEIAAGLFILLYLSKRIFVQNTRSSRLTESITFTFIIIAVINSTGGLSSPFFFLLYFLLFALSLLLEPIISIVMSLALIVFYIITLSPGESIVTIMPVFSLALMTPFALFTGQEYLKYHIEKNKSDRLNTERVTEHEQSFLFLSLILKNHINSIKKSVENFNGDHELHEIRKQASEMEKLIDNYEKEL